MRALLTCLFLVVAPLTAQQDAQQPAPLAHPPTAVSPPPAGSLPGDLLPFITEVERSASSAAVSVARLRIEKWKARGGQKDEAQERAAALERNLTQGLPAVLDQVRAQPQSLPALFKLYRNLDALHDVLASLAESAGAFGPEEEFHSLAQEAANLDEARRDLAERFEALAMAKEAEIQRLRAGPQSQQDASAPRKIIIDDTAPPKKKKPAAKKKPS